jgi:signal transduction histidine kinase
MDINTCAVLSEASGLRSIALYSHVVPAAIAVFLGFFTLLKSKASRLSVAFLFFTLAVAIWLIADVVLWTVPNYSLVAFFWSWIDFVDVVFFVLAAYFFGVLSRNGVSPLEKLALIAVCIPPLAFTLTGNSVVGFDHTWCELFNNDHSVLFKSLAEWVSVALMFVSLIVAWRKTDGKKRVAITVVFVALVLFLAAFSATEYIAAQTAVYEINLYGLFVLPVFLIAMVFAITNLEVFKIQYLGAQVLIYVLIMLVASQLLFLESSTDALLNGLTLALSFIVGLVLLENEKRELDSLVKTERLAQELSVANARLHELDHLKSQFLSFASHQLKSPLTAIKWQAQLLTDGTKSGVPQDVAHGLHDIERSADNLIAMVNDFLDLRRIEEGRMEYAFELIDAVPVIRQTVERIRPIADHKKLSLVIEAPEKPCMVKLDAGKMEQVIRNLVDNAIKYTDAGTILVHVDCDDSALSVSVTDTGRGMNQAIIPKLFEQFVREPGTEKVIEGTGLGLYIAKRIVEAHRGRISASSDGPGKGSTFFFAIPK